MAAFFHIGLICADMKDALGFVAVKRACELFSFAGAGVFRRL